VPQFKYLVAEVAVAGEEGEAADTILLRQWLALAQQPVLL
jgi:hypothetical protein